jgi:hypothetical protein
LIVSVWLRLSFRFDMSSTNLGKASYDKKFKRLLAGRSSQAARRSGSCTAAGISWAEFSEVREPAGDGLTHRT